MINRLRNSLCLILGKIENAFKIRCCIRVSKDSIYLLFKGLRDGNLVHYFSECCVQRLHFPAPSLIEMLQKYMRLFGVILM